MVKKFVKMICPLTSAGVGSLGARFFLKKLDLFRTIHTGSHHRLYNMSLPSSKTGASPPSPLSPAARRTPANFQVPKPSVVATMGPAGAFMVELLVYNDAPFKDTEFTGCARTTTLILVF